MFASGPLMLASKPDRRDIRDFLDDGETRLDDSSGKPTGHGQTMSTCKADSAETAPSVKRQSARDTSISMLPYPWENRRAATCHEGYATHLE